MRLTILGWLAVTILGAALLSGCAAAPAYPTYVCVPVSTDRGPAMICAPVKEKPP